MWKQQRDWHLNCGKFSLAKISLHITKWAGNSREVMTSIPSSKRVTSIMINLDFDSFPDSYSWNPLEYRGRTISFLYGENERDKYKKSNGIVGQLIV